MNMANDKLQQLSERLYSEGLVKGQREGEKILKDSREKARQILLQAEQQAQQIISDARQQAEKDAAKAVSDIRMASAQAIDATKACIENLIQAAAVERKVSETLCQSSFIKEIITLVSRNFSTESSADLSVILPEELKGQIEEYITGELSQAIGRGIEVSYDKKLKAGFNIAPREGKYYISFSESAFSELIREYLRPATRKVLFGE